MPHRDTGAVSRPGAFAPGNELSLSHGVWSERTSDPIVTALVAELLEQRPDLRRYPGSLYAWASAEARLLLISTTLSQRGLTDSRGRMRKNWADLESRYMRLAREARADLGLSPRSEADLAKARIEAQSAGFDLAAVIDAGRKVLDAQGIDTTATGYGAQSLAVGNGNGAAPEHAERQA